MLQVNLSGDNGKYQSDARGEEPGHAVTSEQGATEYKTLKEKKQMKTLSQVKRENQEYSRLIDAVIKRIGLDSVEDVINHGIGGGFSGFIYYADTVKFYKTHKKDILNLARNMAYDLGEGVISMVGGFNCLKYYDYNKGWVDLEGQEVIGKTLYGSGVDDVVANAMAWFAAEEVCRMFDE